jgi:lysozyme
VDLDKLRSELKRDEGIRLRAYVCSAGHRTIGYGHNLSARGLDHLKACTLEQAKAWLEQDIIEAGKVAKKLFPTFDELSDARQRVVVNMAFCLGWNLSRFNMLKLAVARRDWVWAAGEILDSTFARQTGSRAQRLAQMMREG